MLFCKHDLSYQMADELADPCPLWREFLMAELFTFPVSDMMKITWTAFRIYDRRIAKRAVSQKTAPNKRSRKRVSKSGKRTASGVR